MNGQQVLLFKLLFLFAEKLAEAGPRPMTVTAPQPMSKAFCLHRKVIGGLRFTFLSFAIRSAGFAPHLLFGMS